MAMLATMIINTHEYFRKTVNFKTPVCLYRRPLDYLNISYTVVLIISSGFEDLNFLVSPKIGGIGNIDQILIFLDSV